MKKLLISLFAIALAACSGEQQSPPVPSPTPAPSQSTAPASSDTAPTEGTAQGYGNDMLPSADVIAVQNAEKQDGDTDARSEWDENSCAVYDGVAPSGERARHPLMGEDNQPICTR